MKHLALIGLLCIGSVFGGTANLTLEHVPTNGTSDVAESDPSAMSNETNSLLPISYDNRTTRIYGGETVAVGEAPWQVAIYDGISFFCSGAFVSSRSVITTASCVYGLNPALLSVRYGSLDRYGPKMIPVERIVAHSSYNPSSILHNNIAIVHLESPFDWTNTNAAVVDVTSSPLTYGTYVTLTGWGKTSATSGLSRPLLKGDFRVSNIASNYPIFYIASSSYSVCLGDRGGPVTQAGKLVGIASSGSGCNAANISYGYAVTDLYPLLDWILDNSVNPR